MCCEKAIADAQTLSKFTCGKFTFSSMKKIESVYAVFEITKQSKNFIPWLDELIHNICNVQLQTNYASQLQKFIKLSYWEV